MHGILQCLQGSMRVYCRVKPLDNSDAVLKTEAEFQLAFRKSANDEMQNCISIGQQFSKQELPTSIELRLGQREKQDFHFNGVFPPDACQNRVFQEIKPFIQSAVDGEDVCIFAYGQTGSGKTHTMEGPNSELLFNETTKQVHELSGILPRTAVHLFNEISRV